MMNVHLVDQINNFIMVILRDKSPLELNNFKEFIKFYYKDVIKLLSGTTMICNRQTLLDVVLSVLRDDFSFLSSADRVETEHLISKMCNDETDVKFAEEICDILYRRKINALFNYGIPVNVCRQLILHSILEDKCVGIREVNNDIIEYHNNAPIVIDHRFIMAVYGILYDEMEPVLLTFMILDEISFGESLKENGVYYNSFALAVGNIMCTCKVPELVAVLYAYTNNLENKRYSLIKKFPYNLLNRDHPAIEAINTLKQRGVNV